MSDQKPEWEPGASFEARERGLQQSLADGWEEISRRAGADLRCRTGCDGCCREPFPISRLDARWLRAGMSALTESEPDVVNAIRGRAIALLRRWRGRFPGNLESGLLSDNIDALDRFFSEERGQACPVLQPGTGACLLYAHRPVPCRTFGPPLKFGKEEANPCRLCFRGASPAKTEACRWEPDPEEREAELRIELGAAPEGVWETMIACVVAKEFLDEES